MVLVVVAVVEMTVVVSGTGSVAASVTASGLLGKVVTIDGSRAKMVSASFSMEVVSSTENCSNVEDVVAVVVVGAVVVGGDVSEVTEDVDVVAGVAVVVVGSSWSCRPVISIHRPCLKILSLDPQEIFLHLAKNGS